MAELETVQCPHCNNGKVSCPYCNGKGKVSDGSFGNRQVACTHCHGSGVGFCKYCRGTGKIKRVPK
jgi:DnaJ-class molecular chaperone